MNAKNKRVLTVIRCSSERMVENMHKSKYIAMVAAAAMDAEARVENSLK
jgi:hypothetical protein